MNRALLIKRLRNEYLAALPALHGVRQRMADDLGRALEAAGNHTCSQIQSRVKSWDSVAAKIARQKIAPNHIGEISDLVGLRVVLLFPQEIKVVCGILASLFQVISHLDAQSWLKDNEFGYRSQHCIVEIPSMLLETELKRRLKVCNAEIQMRTMAQHIWASISHRVVYRNSSLNESYRRRAVYALAALLEIVDMELERVGREVRLPGTTDHAKKRRHLGKLSRSRLLGHSIQKLR